MTVLPSITAECTGKSESFLAGRPTVTFRGPHGGEFTISGRLGLVEIMEVGKVYCWSVALVEQAGVPGKATE